MKISILSPNLSTNCMGRVYLLAKMLSKKYDVEIVGPIQKEGIWNPIKNEKLLNYKIIDCKFNLFEIQKKIDGDIIYAIKPLGTSFFYGLIKKFCHKKILILDIDDWEMGFYLDYPMIKRLKSFFAIWDLNNFLNTFILQKLIKFSNQLTVSSSFLRKRFGGIIISHARDTDILNSKKYDRYEIRKKWGLKDKNVIMFLGTIKKYKGIDNLVESIRLLKDEKITLMIIGIDSNDKWVAELRKKLSNIIFIGSQPFNKIPEFLSIADLVVIPQKKSLSTMGQIPAKVFDAMAMAKPIIATNVSDLPKILRGCGVIIKPGDTNQMANKINYLFDNPNKAKELGIKARKKCIKKYSFKAITPKLLKLFKKYESIAPSY